MSTNQSDFIGLSQNEVRELQKKYGKNVLPKVKEGGILKILLSQFASPLVYVILAAALISLFLKEFKDAIIILVVVFLNVVMGFFQEYRTEKIYLALKSLLKPMAEVIREGKRQEILVEELVPGDLVILNAGDKVPADGLILESAILAVNEAILTGESNLIFKDTEKENQVFMGTMVASGRATMKVAKIGAATELGKIALSLFTTKSAPTPLQIQLKKFSLSLTYLVLLLVLIVFFISFWEFHLFWESLRLGVVLAVAAIPEGLVIAVTIILVLGLQRILKRRGLIKRLLAVETLGAVTTICTDKTGTLTEGNMRVTQTDFVDLPKAHLALILCNNLEDNLEVAFWDYVRKQPAFDREIDHGRVYPRLFEEPFSSENKYMATVNRIDGKETAFIKGAAEVILGMCKISATEKEKILVKADEWASQGLKVLGLAYKENGQIKIKQDFIWLGLVGVEDPLREGVKEAMALCHQAKIKVKIVSGDHPKTVQKVAELLGFKVAEDQIMTGQTLEKISLDELKEKIEKLIIFARISPHQKLKIVEALQAKNEIVAMVGDGVNDAPAIKKANIGIATGEVSDVAKEAASLILLDSNFKTIVAAVEEGRVIFENIKKVVNYVISNSFDELYVITVALFLGWAAPITVVQILWINLICDGPVDIVLGFEPKEKEIMGESPQAFKQAILDRWGKFLIFIVTFVAGTTSLFYFWYFAVLKGDLILGRTIVFTTLTVVSLVYIFSFRSFRHSFLKTKNLFQNKYLILAVIAGFLLQILVVYAPYLNHLFGIKPLALEHWFLALLPGIIVVAIIEMIKTLKFNRRM